MAKKLGYERCMTVRTSYLHDDGSYPKDANDALREYPEKIEVYLKQAKLFDLFIKEVKLLKI